MTALDPGPSETSTPPAQRPRNALGASLARFREVISRPLTCYYLILGCTGLLLVIGLIMVLSSSSVYAYKAHDGDSYAIVKRQLLWVVIGLPCAWLASRMPDRILRALAWPAYGVAVVLLALTWQFGTEVGGNTNWLAVGPVMIQPSEIAKLSLVLWSASMYARRHHLAGDWRKIITPVVPGMLLAVGLVLAGRDLGTALVLFAIMLGMLWVVGAPQKMFAVAFAVVAVAAFTLAATNETRLARLTTFTDPFADFHQTGWQPAHGLYALSSGGIWGRGLGGSRQKWGELPEAHTDFIFAVLGEELGLLGTLLVIALFGLLAWAALRVARTSSENFVRFMSFGIVVWLLGQMMINVGMVLALLPVVGIPLPLMSYGGSALVPSLVALGLLVGFARRDPEVARALDLRDGRSRSVGLSAGSLWRRGR